MRKLLLSVTLILTLAILAPTVSAETVWVTNNMVVNDNHWDIHYDGKTCFQWQLHEGEPIPTVVNNPIATVREIPIDDFDFIQIQECRGSWGVVG